MTTQEIKSYAENYFRDNFGKTISKFQESEENKFDTFLDDVVERLKIDIQDLNRGDPLVFGGLLDDYTNAFKLEFLDNNELGGTIAGR